MKEAEAREWNRKLSELEEKLSKWKEEAVKIDNLNHTVSTFYCATGFTPISSWLKTKR
jgi:hypothetical protein